MTWHLRRLRRRQAERDQRLLLVMTAGAAGGKAAMKLFRMLEQETQPERERGPEREGGSEIPLSQEDFERIMQEE